MKKIIAIAILSLCLSACGIKPGTVSPPPGQEDVKFPRTYPDTSTDPMPGGPPPF